jgi:uncharacterized RDD family membrane protein YckC
MRVQTSDNVSVGYATAGIGSRLVAQIIDNALASILTIAALLAGLALARLATSTSGAVLAIGTATAFATFLYAGYFFVSELVSGGRTLGKLAMGLRVLRVGGAAPDFPAIAVRNIVRIIDVLFGIGLIVMFINPMSRRLGDLAGGTVVVRERVATPLASVVTPPPIFLRSPDAGPPVDGIARLGETEHNALRIFLTRQGLSPELRQKLAGELATRLYDRLELAPGAPERSWPAELFIERLYLQLDRLPQ